MNVIVTDSHTLHNSVSHFVLILSIFIDRSDPNSVHTTCTYDSRHSVNFVGTATVKVKVKQSRYRPGVAQRVPGS